MAGGFKLCGVALIAAGADFFGGTGFRAGGSGGHGLPAGAGVMDIGGGRGVAERSPPVGVPAVEHIYDAVAAIERIAADARDGGRDGDAGQTAAVREGIRLDDGNTVGNVDGSQIEALIEGSLTDGGDIGGDADLGQLVAAEEGAVADAGKAVRERDAGQALAVVEGMILDDRNTGGDADPGQAAAAEKAGRCIF